MILLSTIFTISKKRLVKNSFEILPDSGIEIRGAYLPPPTGIYFIDYPASWQAKGQVESMQSLPLGKCFPKPYVNPCRFFIHFVVFFFSSIWVKLAYKRWRVILNYKQFLMSIYTKNKLEPVFVKHYASNICLPLNMAKFTQCSISIKQFGLCRKVKQVIYSSSPFQSTSSNVVDKVEMPFAEVHNSSKTWQHLFKR